MYELDKEKVGKFIAELRKEKRMTQKELAACLKVSDKTVSKWETANGIPDISMLMPIADVFGITVTELLQGQRLAGSQKLDVTEVDALLKQTLQLSEEKKKALYQERRKNILPYFVCLGIGLFEVLVLYLWRGMQGIGVCLPTIMAMAAGFGMYYTFFIKMELPSYYDENKIDYYTDGFMKLSVPGMYINNRNWSYVVRAGQKGMNVILTGYPAIRFALVCFLQERMGTGLDMLELVIVLPLFFVCLFLPLVSAAKKHQ